MKARLGRRAPRTDAAPPRADAYWTTTLACGCLIRLSGYRPCRAHAVTDAGLRTEVAAERTAKEARP